MGLDEGDNGGRKCARQEGIREVSKKVLRTMVRT